MSNIDWKMYSSENADNSVYKNNLLNTANSEYWALLNRDRYDVSKARGIVESNDLLAGYGIIVICAGEGEELVDANLQTILGFNSIDIVGLVVDWRITECIGKYNIKLDTLTDYELLCRMMELTDKCVLVFDNVEEASFKLDESEMKGYSFIIRKYLGRMRNMGILNDIVSNLYSAAAQRGMKEMFSDILDDMLTSEEKFEDIEWNTRPYVIFRGGDTCYGVLRDFADSMANALTEIGQAVYVIDRGKIDYEYIQNSNFKAWIGFQTSAFRLDFINKLSGYKIQYWLDNPVFYQKMFMEIPDEWHIMCQDNNYVEFIREFYKKDARQMPPAGHKQLYNEDEERPYDIVFIAGFREIGDEPLTEPENKYYEYMLQHPNMTFSEGLSKYYNDEGIEIDKKHIPEILTEYSTACQRLINYYRKKVVDKILEAGYELHVYGDTWDAYHSPWEDRLIKHNSVNTEEAIAEWRKAKIGLNVMSWHKAGMTERIANIMLSGAACLTDETDYLTEHFDNGKQIQCFSLKDIESLADLVHKLLENDTWMTVGKNGYDIAVAEHTWNNRAEELNKLIEEWHDK